MAKWEQVGSTFIGDNDSDYTGFTVSLTDNGNYLAIGSPQIEDLKGSGEGYVRVYEFIDDSSGGEWHQLGNDISVNGSDEDDTGYSVSLIESGYYGLLVGITSPYKEDDDIPGEVHVYNYDVSSEIWNQFGNTIYNDAVGDGDDLESYSCVKLMSNSQYDSSYNLVLGIGVEQDEITDDDTGYVHIYYYDRADGSWNPLGGNDNNLILGKSPDGYFGHSISLINTTTVTRIAVGAPYAMDANDDDETGAAYVYEFNEDDNSWNQVGSNIYGLNDSDETGWSVALSGSSANVLIIGEPNFDNAAGQVRVFEYIDASGDWYQKGNDISGEQPDFKAGYSVAISDDGETISVGSIGYETDTSDNVGRVRVFDYDGSLNKWVQYGEDLVGFGVKNDKGFSIAMDSTGEYVAAGAPAQSGNSNDQIVGGYVMVHKRIPTASTCFTADAIVSVDRGNIPICLVTTKDTICNEPIMGVSKAFYTQDRLIHVKKHAFGKYKPNKDITVAPYHKFMINGKLRMICNYVNNNTIYYKKYKDELLYNIILKKNHTMKVNNMIVGTLEPQLLISSLFNNTLTQKEKKKVSRSIREHHRRVKKENRKELKNFLV